MEPNASQSHAAAQPSRPPGMAGVTAWTLAGASGRDYAFTVHGRGARFRAVGAVFVLGYLHPRGHLAGFVLHPLYVGQTSDLARTLAAPPHGDCLRAQCWNCVCALATGAGEDERRDAMLDLLAAHHAPCNP
ncbi:hypothetical protein [Desulfocurvus sp. DL9XJH121]